MEIENSSIQREIDLITASAKPVHFTYTAKIYVGDVAYDPIRVTSIDFLTDPESNYSDVIMMEAQIAGGTYAKRIYPNKEILNVVLYKNPITEVGDTPDPDAPIQSERYTATLIDKGNPMLESNGINSPSEEALNLTNIFAIEFQLVNKALEQLRMISVGGIYRNTTVQDVIKAVMTKESKIVNTDQVRVPVGVDMVDASNDDIRDHVVLPQGLPLVHLPQYVQEKCGGVYNAGLGYYFQGDHWYVFPCYDVTRFNDGDPTLTIINIPANRMPGIERTYRQDGGNLVILATGEVKFRDDSESQQLNKGNGVRFADADKLADGFGTIAGNKITLSRGSNVNEYTATQRKNGNNNVQLSNKAINANPYLEASKLARRLGSLLTLVWENSDYTLITPGMPTKIMYLDGDDIKTVYGLVLSMHSFAKTKEKGAIASRHMTNSMLKLFVQRIESDT